MRYGQETESLMALPEYLSEMMDFGMEEITAVQLF